MKKVLYILFALATVGAFVVELIFKAPGRGELLGAVAGSAGVTIGIAILGVLLVLFARRRRKAVAGFLVLGRRIGRYEYDKRADDGSTRRCQVDVFPLFVATMDIVWPEFGERRRRWVLVEETADMVDEERLAAILKEFNPQRGKRHS